MKKNITISLIVSVTTSVILMVLNRIYAAIAGHILGLTIPGGDCVEEIDFERACFEYQRDWIHIERFGL